MMLVTRHGRVQTAGTQVNLPDKMCAENLTLGFCFFLTSFIILH
jgi:hypothetical protein